MMFLGIEQAKIKTSKIKSLCFAVYDAAQSDGVCADLYISALKLMADQLIELENELGCIESEMGKEKAPAAPARATSAESQHKVD